MGFIDSEEDKQILEHCTSLSCALIRRPSEKEGEEEEEIYSALFKFADNELIKNKELKAVLSRKGDDIKRKELTPIKFKNDESHEDSLLAVMFDPNAPEGHLYEYLQDIYRAYSNSVFFYFYESKEEEGVE